MREKLVDGKRIRLSNEENADRNKEERLWSEKAPLRGWMALMAESDAMDMPRWFEDHIERDHNGVSIDEGLQKRYDRKKRKRESKETIANIVRDKD